MQRRHALGLAVACLPGLSSPARAAGSFSVFPTQLRFDERIGTASLRLSNLGSTLGVFQVDPRIWTAEGVDESATELIINPTIVSVAPGRQQMLRVGLTRQPPSPVERAFRIYLQQVEGERSPSGTGTELLLRIGVPVFVAPIERRTLPLELRLQREGERLQVQITNPSNHHQRLLRVRWQDGDGAWVEVDTRPVYVLAQSTVRFATPLPTGVRGGDLEVHHDEGAVSTPLPPRA